MKGVFSASQVYRFCTSKTQAIFYSLTLKTMVLRKLRNLVSRKAQAADFNKTAKTQPSLDHEQPEPTLTCSLRSSPTVAEVSNKDHKRRRRSSRQYCC